MRERAAAAPTIGKRITLLIGHPDPAPGRFCRALSQAYAEGARRAGHEVRTVDVAKIDFPVLRGKDDWETGPLPENLRESQDAIGWAEHIVLVFPLWLGTMPALVKAFLEQVLRPGFAVGGGGSPWEKRLSGRSARIVVTMGMPAFVYRWVFGAHGLKGLERNVLSFVGIRPVRETLIGGVEGKPEARTKWLSKMRALGEEGL
ncbi:MAG TPA: NAD(P)H-dependent oxidoreductase [Burkholderiales bacterium]|nr:NAD(P)H-dependent oxidoreductase [Burkholderiales bacterium]